MKASKLIEQLERMIKLYGDKEVCLWEVDLFNFKNNDIGWIQTTAEDVKLVSFKNDGKVKCGLDGQEIFMIEK